MKNAILSGNKARFFIVLIISTANLVNISGLFAQAPVAGFTANVVAGCSPLVVQFTDQSTNSPSSWYWDLGNGSTSTVPNPTATYTTPGTYTISLTATNASGSNTITKTNYITIYTAPTAKFTSTDTSGCAPLTVNFSDQSTTPAGNITQWEWSFGDGGTSNAQNPTHTYVNSGTYNVFLKVTNNNGCTQTIFKQQYIRAGAGAEADFIVNMPNYCQAPVTINFSNTTQVDGSATFLWDFGDGGTSTATNPSHTYSSYGTFTVTLTVQTADGCGGSKQKVIELSPKNVSFSGPSTICVGVNATFTVTSSPTPLSQTWDMGDGISYSTPTVTHSYGTVGTYVITLTNEFAGGCTASTTQTINVISGPTIDFTADTTKACKPPFTVNFQSSGAASGYTWDFGDGGTSSQPNPTHTYTTTGVFDVILTAVNATGCVTTKVGPALIQIQAPSLSITNLPVNDGCTPYAFSPIANITAADGVASYFWDFGNGVTSTNPTPTYNYTTPGVYTIKLRIQTNGGCVDSVVYQDAVKIGNGTTFDFTAIPIPNCVDRPVKFTMSTTVSPTSYTWYFGDGDSSVLLSPTHSYAAAGQYSIVLEIKYGNCRSRLLKDQYVNILPPQANFSAVRDCNNKRLIRFTNESVGAGNLLWDFGDGNSSTTTNPSHTYAADGNYPVSLIIDNGTCTDTLVQVIEVSSAGVDVTVDKPISCKGTMLTLRAVVPNTVNAAQFEWTISNFNIITTQEDTVSFALPNAGVYDVSLKVTSKDSCADVVSKQGFLTVYGPTADFNSDKTGGCLNTTINFADSSVSDGIHPIVQWDWNFGDTTTGSGLTTSHAYPVKGRYDVTLIVTDTYGCTNTRTKVNLINITDGKAMFTSTDSMSCLTKNVVFRDTSRGSISFWEWDFGDGSGTSSIQNPAHVYADSGQYTVKLKITENSGCMDSVIKTNYVTIRNPKAAFTLSDTFSTCPPLTVHFYDNSYYVKKWSWDFGDGGSSPSPSPTNLYNIPNTYRIRLLVTSPGGCTDSAFAQVRILGPYGQFNYSPLIGCTPFPVTYNVTTSTAVKFLWDYSDGIVDSGTAANSSHTYLSGGKFVPKVILTDAQGCSVPVIGIDTIYIEKTNLEFTASPVSFCDSGTAAFTNYSFANATSASYQWLFGDGNSDTATNTSHLYSSPGWYTVTLKATTPLGCVDTLTRANYIRVNNSPVATIISADSLCKPATFNFSAQLQPDTSGIKTWHWTFGNGQTSSSQNPPPQLFSTEGNYNNTLFVEDNQGCTDTASKMVVVHPLPQVVASQDVLICRGDSTPLSASGAVSYSWLAPNNNLSCTNCANPLAFPPFDTYYKVEGRSQYGCAGYDSVLVKVFQPYAISVSPSADSICQGSSVILKASGAPLYAWSPSTGLSAANISNPVASPNISTTYKVVGYDSLGCFNDSLNVAISVFANPTVNAGPDINLSAGNTVTIPATASSDVVKYSWLPSIGLSCIDCLNPTVTGGSDVTYTIKVQNAIGCTAQDQVKVIVTCNEGNLFVPNTFSPNGDGMNDVFYVRGKGVFAIRSMRIYNRWGEMIFEKKEITANNPNDGWNGTYKGAIASSDTYVYQLEVLCTNTQVVKYNGTISLIR